MKLIRPHKSLEKGRGWTKTFASAVLVGLFCFIFERHLVNISCCPQKKAASKFIFAKRKRVVGLKANIAPLPVCVACEFSCFKGGWIHKQNNLSCSSHYNTLTNAQVYTARCISTSVCLFLPSDCVCCVCRASWAHTKRRGAQSNSRVEPLCAHLWTKEKKSWFFFLRHFPHIRHKRGTKIFVANIGMRWGISARFICREKSGWIHFGVIKKFLFSAGGRILISPALWKSNAASARSGGESGAVAAAPPPLIKLLLLSRVRTR